MAKWWRVIDTVFYIALGAIWGLFLNAVVNSLAPSLLLAFIVMCVGGTFITRWLLRKALEQTVKEIQERVRFIESKQVELNGILVRQKGFLTEAQAILARHGVHLSL